MIVGRLLPKFRHIGGPHLVRALSWVQSTPNWLDPTSTELKRQQFFADFGIRRTTPRLLFFIQLFHTAVWPPVACFSMKHRRCPAHTSNRVLAASPPRRSLASFPASRRTVPGRKQRAVRDTVNHLFRDEMARACLPAPPARIHASCARLVFTLQRPRIAAADRASLRWPRMGAFGRSAACA